MSDIRQSLKYGLYMEKIGWQTEIIGGCQIFLRKVPFFGSIIKIQRSVSAPFVQLGKLVKSSRGFLVSVEPQTEELVPQLLQHGFRRNNGAMIPSKTRQIDLKPSEEEIFQTFNRTRKYKINKAKKNALTSFKIKIGCAGSSPIFEERNERSESSRVLYRRKLPVNDLSAVGNLQLINDFIILWSQNALKRGFWVPIKDQIRAQYETFGEDAYLLGAYSISDLGHLDDLLAGILLIISGETAHYFYAASNETGRKLSAPSLLTWEAMKLAKKKGCAIFDFEGIYDERFPQKSWSGFSYFKESFGGYEVSYPGRFIKTQGLLSRLLFF